MLLMMLKRMDRLTEKGGGMDIGWTNTLKSRVEGMKSREIGENEGGRRGRYGKMEGRVCERSLTIL
jgi:hypothetical protein